MTVDKFDSQVTDFLIRAKKATYAGKGGESESSRPASHDLQYSEGGLTYIDTYLGGERFAGEEALWHDGEPFWAMNYVGRVTGENFSGDFLKEALLRVRADKPFRGPERFADGGYVYECEVSGDTSWFSGREIISLNGVQIYECLFHGGSIK
ncbi:DUF5680 domain-containing protein [Ruminococcus albus]|uniref:DUF5680 domain-containing protein n=1 Tax=Ruminococcus albus TaxID=1264 RepID=UPI0009453BA2|nr:DUF5680 domain-containing protein [Ruminococcus albus]